MVKLLSLTDAEWREILDRLTVHAIYKSRKLVWRGMSGSKFQSMPGGLDPAGLAADVIQRYIEGVRYKEVSSKDELLKFLLSSVDSRISHLVRSTENKKTLLAPQRSDGSEVDGWAGVTRPSEDPVEVLISTESAARYQERAAKALDGEPKLLELFQCLAEGIEGRDELATLLEVTETEITNMKKRLGRKLEPVRNEVRKEAHGPTKSIR